MSQKQNYQEYIEIEFVVANKHESPKFEEQSTAYKLLKQLTKKELRSDRKMRKNSYVKFDRPANIFAPAEYRISR